MKNTRIRNRKGTGPGAGGKRPGSGMPSKKRNAELEEKINKLADNNPNPDKSTIKNRAKSKINIATIMESKKIGTNKGNKTDNCKKANNKGLPKYHHDVVRDEDGNIDGYMEYKLDHIAVGDIFDYSQLSGDSNQKQIKELLLRKLITNYGNESKTLTDLKYSRQLMYTLKTPGDKNYDPVFKEYYDQIMDILVDYVETKFYNLIDEGDKQAIMFFLKTKGVNRGWIEKSIVHNIGDNNDKISINIVKPTDLNISDADIIEE